MQFGCSSFAWDTLDHKHLLGRTYDEYGDLKGNRIAVIPKGYSMKILPEDGLRAVKTAEDEDRNLAVKAAENGDRTVTTAYAMAGMAVVGLSAPIMVDGVNEKGLMGALLNYPGYAVYDEFKKCSGRRVHPGFLVGYLLGCAGSVAEAVKELEAVELADEPVFGEHMSIHYIFSDRTGEAIVVEPGEGGIRIHRDTIGVMTNSPDYIWHRTNLRNYTGVFYGERERKFLNMKLSGFGEALGGGFGLPGDYSSPSRFVRLAALKEASVKGKNELDGITRMFHIFSAVDIPEGILRSPSEEKGYEKTLCISAMCAESGTYYFSVAENRRICALRLDGGCGKGEIKYFELPGVQDVDYWN